MHIRDDERLAQDLDHRDRRADRRLEAKLNARLRGSREELGATPRDELLVRRDDVLAGTQEIQHVVRRRLGPAHDLRDHGDRRVVADRLEVRREHTLCAQRIPPAPGIPDERPNDPKPVSRCTLDVVGAVLEQPVHGRADTAVAEERDRDVDRIESRSHRTSLGGWPRTCQRNWRNPNPAFPRSGDRSLGAKPLSFEERQGEGLRYGELE